MGPVKLLQRLLGADWCSWGRNLFYNQFDSFLTEWDHSRKKSRSYSIDLLTGLRPSRRVTWSPSDCPARQIMQIFRVCQLELSLFSSLQSVRFLRENYNWCGNYHHSPPLLPHWSSTLYNSLYSCQMYFLSLSFAINEVRDCLLPCKTQFSWSINIYRWDEHFYLECWTI